MENKNTLIENIAALKAEQTDLTILQRDFDKICAEKKRDCYALYEKHYLEAKKFFNDIPKNIIKTILDNFTPFLSGAGGYLCLNGKKIPSAPFDYSNCFVVYNNAENAFRASVAAVSPKFTERQPSEQTLKALYQLCVSYNTIFDIYKSTNSMFQAQWNDEYQSLCSQKHAADKRIAAIKTEIVSLEMKLQTLIEKTNKMKAEMQFHHNNKAENSFVSNINIPLGYSTDKNGQIESVCEWQPTSNNILRIVVPEGMEKDDCLSSMLKNIVLNFYNSYPVGAFRTLICDEYQFLELDNLINDIHGHANSDDEITIDRSLFFKNDSTASGIYTKNTDALNFCYELLSNRAVYRNILDFNSKNPDMYVPLVLVLVNGYRSDSSLFDSNSKSWMENGKKLGVYFVFTEHQSNHNGRFRDVSLEELEPQSIYLQKEHNSDLSFQSKNTQFIACQVDSKCDLNAYSKTLLERIKTSSNIVPLENVINDYERDDDFSKVLKIPVGKTNDGKSEVLALYSTDSRAHCMLAGKTGSGKSSLLQAIVLGCAYHYSPDELEIYLIDLKDGSGFYKKNRDYSKLKHVKMMSTNCRKQDVIEFVHHIAQTKLKIGDEASDIVSYNKGRAKKDLMKRAIIVIDEYTSITDKTYIKDLVEIAKKGRSFGVSLILASQQYDSEFSGVKDNIGHIYEFINEKYNLIKDDRKADYSYLSLLQGNCLKKEDDNISKFRVAYTPNQNEFIEIINNKYAEIDYIKPVNIGSENISRENFSKLSCGIHINNANNDDLNCLVGKSVMGFDSVIKVQESPLLIGSEKRARNLEYSILKEICSKSPKTPKIYYLDNDYKHETNIDNFVDAISDVTEYHNTPSSIVEILRSLYTEYKGRDKCDYDNSEKKDKCVAFEPIIVLLHNFGVGQKLSIAQDKLWNQEKENKKSAIVRKSESTIDDELTDILSFDNMDLDELTHTSDMCPELQANSVIELLPEMIRNARAYGIYFITHIDAYAERSLGQKLLQLSDNGVIIVPDTSKKESSHSRKLIMDVTKLTHNRLADYIAQETEMSTELLNRMYYIKNDIDYEQIVPFEYD